MKKETVGIIGGKGKMGRFFGRFFTEHGFHVIIADKGTALSNSDVAKTADIVIVSVPIAATAEVIAEIGPHVRKESLLMDLTSIKAPFVKKMLECSKSAVLGCHPLFGPTNTLKGQVCVFCEGRGKKWAQKMQKLLEESGAEVRWLDPEVHDELMTVVQGLMHFLDITVTKTLADTGIPVREYFSFRSPSYRLKLDLAGRTLYQDPDLYGQIAMENPKTPQILEKFQKNAERLKSSIERKDFSGFLDFWKKAKIYLGDFAEVCQKESDQVIDFLSATTAAVKKGKAEAAKRGKLGVLGPEYTFSHLAAQKFLPNLQPMVFFRTIPEAFAAFADKKVENLLVPIENKIQGTVRETLDGLFTSPEEIQAVFRLPIDFVLAGLPGSEVHELKTIFSHSQALSQCSDKLHQKFPAADLIPLGSTTEAIRKILRERNPETAVICSEEAAKHAGLAIRLRNFANSAQNETWFAFLSHRRHKFTPKKSMLRSSVAFYFDQDSPGTLASVLNDYAEAKINLTKIESRPAGHNFGDYLFFLDFEGTLYSPTVQEVLEKTEKKVAELKLLGSYAVISEL